MKGSLRVEWEVGEVLWDLVEVRVLGVCVGGIVGGV